MRRWLFLALLATSQAFAGDDALWLHVKGKEIVTSPKSEGGERAFIPVGIGYCRNVIIHAQDDEVFKFCKAHSLNTVRLAFYLHRFNGRPEKPIDLGQHIAEHIEPVIAAARQHNLYVILDDHEYLSAPIDEALARQKQDALPWDEATIEKWVSGWAKVAEHYKDEPHILGYELLNEPHDADPEFVRQVYTRAIQAIRKVDTRHIIIVGNHVWSHSRALEKTWGETATKLDAPYNNIVFAFHDYPEDDHPWKVQKYVTTFRDKYNVPVLCTEFGATHWNKSETVCREFEAGMLALFAKENIGWMIWALKTLEDHPRNPYNEVDKVGMDPKVFDSCAYSDLWAPVARIMASPKPRAKAPEKAADGK